MRMAPIQDVAISETVVVHGNKKEIQSQRISMVNLFTYMKLKSWQLPLVFLQWHQKENPKNFGSNVLKHITDDYNSEFWKYKEEITKIVFENELNSNSAKIKNMQTGEEKEVTLDPRNIINNI